MFIRTLRFGVIVLEPFFGMGENMRNRALLAALASVAMTGLGSVAAQAQIYSDTFNSAASAANYNVYQTLNSASGNTSTAVFGFDYSSLGIPAAPANGLTDTGTTALRVQSDDTTATASSYIIGDISVVTKGLVLPSQYTLSVEVWSNYVGGASIADVNGSNSSTGATIGIGTLGTSFDSAVSNAAQGGVLVDAVRDATSGGGTYRVYASGNNYGNPPASGMYTAGNDATASQFGTADDSNFYKTLFPSVSAPAAQSTAAPGTQGGSTPAGVFGFAWHNETLQQTGTNVIWSIDGTVIATIPDSLATAGDSQIALGDQDSNTSTGPTTYNFDLFENLVVTPEPASLSMLGLGAMSLLARRRK
jgi:PEP-CTERM motif